jgi:hypothetical protein
LVVKLEEKRPLEGSRHRWINNTKLLRNKMAGVDLIILAQGKEEWQTLEKKIMKE